MCAVALKNIEIMKREGIVEHVRDTEDVVPREARDAARPRRSSATSAARASSTRSSSSRTRETKQTFDDAECESLLRGYLSPAFFEAGLICRADDRGDPVVQISPPLVAGEAEMDEIVGILGDVLAEAPAACSAGAP